MINAPLLRKTLEHIEHHPEEWKQDRWRCGSGMCFAGHAATIAGGRFLADTDLLVAEDDDPPEDVGQFCNGHRCVAVGDRAERVLGLTFDDRDRLFDSANTLDDLRCIVGELCERAA